jgi:Fic family protein
LNNFRTLEGLDEWLDQDLTPAILSAMHASITEGTLEESGDCGRFRQDDDVEVVDRSTGETVFVPPPFGELAGRMERMCGFANEGEQKDRFMHPVVRATLLRFLMQSRV